MIIDTLANLKEYQKLVPKLPLAIEKMHTLKTWQAGEKYAFDGGYLFFQTGTTKPEAVAQFETHQKYVDVQVLLAGSEYVAWNAPANLTEVTP